MSRLSVIAATLVVSWLLACGDDGGERGSLRPPNAESGGARVIDSEVGAEPGYFVPREPGSPLAIVGRAELATSGKPVELSAEAGREAPIGPAVCVNPAYRGRGRLGIYIPTTCFATPLPKLAIARVQVPEQAVRGYELVIWGVARGVGSRVTARFLDRDAAAAVFAVDGRLLGRVEGEQPFSVFVVELPSDAACEEITIEARGRAGRATDLIQRKSKICRTGGRI